MAQQEPSVQLERIVSMAYEAAFRVHRKLGPGLLESVYEACLEHELKKMGLKVLRQVVLPVIYDGVKLEAGLRIDLLVEDVLIVEVKAVENIHPVFKAQVITYLKLTECLLGLLMNFNVPLIKDGISRIICSDASAGSADLT